MSNHPRTSFSYAIGLAACVAATLGAHSSFAFGLDEVYSPNVDYREIAFEYAHARSFDGDPAKNGAQVGELTFEIGLTPRFVFAVSGEYEAEAGEDLHMTAHQVEGRCQLVESGEYWLDAGLLLAYKFSKQTDAPDEVEFKLLLQKDTGRFTHTANIGFAQSVGKFPQLTNEAGYSFLWNTRYRYDQTFQPGFEIQSDLGVGSQVGYLKQQEHYIGPSVQGKLFGHLKYQAAYLFGMTDPAAQHAARLTLEYETHF